MEVSHVKFQLNTWKGLWICGKIKLWPCANLALLWINIAQNQNCLTVFGESLLYQISTICETLCGKHVKVRLRPYVNQALVCIGIYFVIIS